MTRTNDLIEWLRPFHEQADGRTAEAVRLAVEAIDEAPDAIQQRIVREGLRVAFHAFRRTVNIRVNGDAESVPLFCSTTDADGTIVHRPRYLVPVGEIERQVANWADRRRQSVRELAWWTHQRELAFRAEATPDETLGAVWTRLGVSVALDAEAEAVAL